MPYVKILILSIVITSCFTEQKTEEKTHNKTVIVQTNNEKYELIKSLFSNHGIFENIIFTFYEEENYIHIDAFKSSNGNIKFEYIEDLIWWNNSSYFNTFLLKKIKSKLNEEYPSKRNKITNTPPEIKIKIKRNNSNK
ncbi:hypothetical protein N9W60_00695 [Flavobacteriaceae bacterium]|nr:hypothetical protein [Flavobacteriaceae bacterium]